MPSSDWAIVPPSTGATPIGSGVPCSHSESSSRVQSSTWVSSGLLCTRRSVKDPDVLQPSVLDVAVAVWWPDTACVLPSRAYTIRLADCLRR